MCICHAALMDDDVMKTYTMKSTEARHYIQYDQGEDRWLCTLLLQAGAGDGQKFQNVFMYEFK